MELWCCNAYSILFSCVVIFSWIFTFYSEVAMERETEGDLLLSDIGEG